MAMPNRRKADEAPETIRYFMPASAEDEPGRK
jgi:hypothetical protein